jgi:hypothetical protein
LQIKILLRYFKNRIFLYSYIYLNYLKLHKITVKNKTESLENFIDKVFCAYPKDPCTFNIDENNNINIIFLTHFMIAGATKLFGKIDPKTITLKQFEKLKECMESVGYTINYKIESDKYKIWFERYIEKTNCHGIKVIV